MEDIGIDDVLCEIQHSHHSKSKVMHSDKLAAVHGQYDGSWFQWIPHKKERSPTKDQLEGVAQPRTWRLRKRWKQKMKT